ncbi:hypothetical protein ACWDQ0_37210 [Streptomyces sp. NPDC003642]
MSAPVPQQSRFGGVRPAAVSVVSGSAVVTALTMANAPWQAVVGTVCATLMVSLLLGLAKIVVPDESEHKRDLLLAYFHHRERRAKQREHRAERRIRGRRKGDQGTNSQEQHDRAPEGDPPLR